MKEKSKKEYTELQRRAIVAYPDLPEDMAAIFAEELLTIIIDDGTTFGQLVHNFFHPPIDPNLSPAKPDSIQEMFPHLRNPSFV